MEMFGFNYLFYVNCKAHKNFKIEIVYAVWWYQPLSSLLNTHKVENASPIYAPHKV